MSDRFINPYTFVPFDFQSNSPDRSQPEDTERKNTGFLDVTLTLKTDLIIPDGKKLDTGWKTEIPQDDAGSRRHGHYRLFRLNESPAIPGSSLRGMVRSVFEAASNSCLPFLPDDSGIKMRRPGIINGRIRKKLDQGKWEDLVRDYRPCKDLDSLCPACRLFGTTEASGKSGSGLKGRVRFSDALPVAPESCSVVKRTLPILATPKPTAFEFYVRKPDPQDIDQEEKVVAWDYREYDTSSNETVKTVKRDRKQIPLRGRKFFWHSNPKHDPTIKAGNMNSTMECLKAGGSPFRFKVYFDGITDTELRQLEWSLTFGENLPGGKYCHKLGHARPLGYGSVKLSIDRVTLRRLRWADGKLERTLEVQELPEKIDCEWKNKAMKRSLKRIANIGFNSEKIRVDYPHLSGKPQIFAWFSANRKRRDGIFTLPRPTDPDPSLPSDVDPNGKGKRPGSRRFQ